jgi:hypothetical protein
MSTYTPGQVPPLKESFGWASTDGGMGQAGGGRSSPSRQLATAVSQNHRVYHDDHVKQESKFLSVEQR